MGLIVSAAGPSITQTLRTHQSKFLRSALRVLAIESCESIESQQPLRSQVQSIVSLFDIGSQLEGATFQELEELKRSQPYPCVWSSFAPACLDIKFGKAA
jgi:hypothetical protein